MDQILKYFTNGQDIGITFDKKSTFYLVKYLGFD